MTGANEVPPVTTTATGTATFTAVGGSLLYRVDITSASGMQNITAAHIHGPAAAGANAGVIVNLYVPPAGTAPLTFTGPATLVQGVGSPNSSALSMDSLVAYMRTGRAYVNVHTTANGGGEIRGQVTTP